MKHKLFSGLTALALSLTACGGGGGEGDIGLPIGGGTGGGSASIRINFLTVEPSDLRNASYFTARWNVSYNSISGYTTEVYAYSSPTLSSSGASDYKITGMNCGSIYGTGCSADGYVSCTISLNTFGQRVISCKTPSGQNLPGRATFKVSGNGYIILKACVFDPLGAGTICDQKATPVILP
ncbi:hypothetical protein [Hydrogenobacter thermophilus]|uniref:hypothetical protein n=1 Tax=Hydrogenobacter thermophilus TaxID=940 RepID=UPI0030F710DD